MVLVTDHILFNSISICFIVRFMILYLYFRLNRSILLNKFAPYVESIKCLILNNLKPKKKHLIKF